MNILNRTIATGLAGIFFYSSIGSARKVENWKHEQLLQEAGLVIIARAVSTIRSEDKWEATRFDAKRFVGLETTFKPGSALKGKAPSSLKELHFQYKPGFSPYNDGPELVTFTTKPLTSDTPQNGASGEGVLKEFKPLKRRVETAAPAYLLFLQKRPDGRFEAVSGQIDPNSSVRLLSKEGI